MYTHIGNGTIIKNKDVIGVFDMKTIQSSRNNLRIQHHLKEKNLEGKSVILKETKEGTFEEVVSDIAVSTLKKRLAKGIQL